LNVKPTLIKANSIGDAAIDGLFGGLFAGAVMGVIILLAGLLVGESPASMLSRFSSGQAATPLTGILVHLAVSAVYGMVFCSAIYILPVSFLKKIPGWLAGLFFGIVLLALAEWVLLPGLRSPLLELPLWILLLGHGMYGLVLGMRVYPKFTQ
jgi:hypothetical protein